MRSFDWHPFADRIVVEESDVASVINSGSVFDMYVVNVTTGEMEKLTDDKYCESGLEWSPDGQWILYTHAFETSSDIFILNVDSREIRNMTQSRGIDEFWPTWSPDGEQIAYIQNHKLDLTTDLCVLRVNENIQTCLTSTPNEIENLPRWSPDGRWIAYEVRSLNIPEPSIAIIELNGDIQIPIAVYPTPGRP